MEKNLSSGSSSQTKPNPNTTTNENNEVEAPEWLPAGWEVRGVTRTFGHGAGQTDKYYKGPNSTQWLRSKPEVLSFLQSSDETRRNNLDQSNIETTDNTHPKVRLEGEVPLKVKWIMPDMCKPSWEAEVDGEIVPPSIRKKWADAYTYMALETKNDGVMPEDNA